MGTDYYICIHCNEVTNEHCSKHMDLCFGEDRVQEGRVCHRCAKSLAPNLTYDEENYVFQISQELLEKLIRAQQSKIESAQFRKTQLEKLLTKGN